MGQLAKALRYLHVMFRALEYVRENPMGDPDLWWARADEVIARALQELAYEQTQRDLPRRHRRADAQAA
jgi:hypothetical protein